MIDIVRIGGEISAWPNYECKLAYFGLIRAAKKYILNVIPGFIKVRGTKRRVGKSNIKNQISKVWNPPKADDFLNFAL